MTLNVKEGKIIGTTAQQEFSVDNGWTWADASDGVTSGITFTNGNIVLVRNKISTTEIFNLGTVTIP